MAIMLIKGSMEIVNNKQTQGSLAAEAVQSSKKRNITGGYAEIGGDDKIMLSSRLRSGLR